MLTVVLADAELEMVPARLAGHPAIRSSARRRGRAPTAQLLDSSLHHAALEGVEDGERRGRPDIVHITLLTVLDSVANQAGLVRVLVHTRNDELITIKPETRLPRNFGRFCGLIEGLFAKGAVPEDAKLLTLERGRTLASALDGLEGERVALDIGGEAVEFPGWLAGHRDLVAVIGAFPHGAFRSPVGTLCTRVVSLHEKPLMAWAAAAELLVAYRLAQQGTPKAPVPGGEPGRPPANPAGKRA